MAAPRTLQAAKEIIFAALTDPPVTYFQSLGDNAGYSSVTLPASNVVPRSIWLIGADAPPTPYVCFALKGRGMSSRYIEDRRLELMFWVVGNDENQVAELYEAIRSIVNLGDQDSGFYTRNLGRPATTQHLGAIFRELIEVNAYAPDYDKTTARWQLVAEYAAVAA